MILIIAIILSAVGIAAFEMPAMLRERLYKELVTFLVLLVIGVALAIAVSITTDLPNPYEGIANLYKPITDYIFHILE